MEYDEVIIGAGMAGLYWVHKTRPKNFLVLEKLDRVGGRVWNKIWHGHQISLGGGIIKGTNELTICLAKELGLELGTSISKYHMVGLGLELDKKTQSDKPTKPNEDDFYESNQVVIKYLKKLYRQNKQEIEQRKLTWDEFLDLYLPNKIAQTIKTNLLYKTYSNASPNSVLYHEIDELMRTKPFEIKFILNSGYTGLLDRLIGIVGADNIRLNTNVTKITKSNEMYKVHLSDGQSVITKRIVLATESINGIKFDELDRNITEKINQLYGMFGSSQYIRIYSYHKKSHGLTCSYRTTGLPGKVILINEHILMCCYTEESDATKLLNLLGKNTKQTQLDIIHSLLTNCGIYPISKPDDIVIQFWDTGVHYDKPVYSREKKNEFVRDLKKSGIIVIGEAVSDSHGWVNSAFESVETAISL